MFWLTAQYRKSDSCIWKDNPRWKHVLYTKQEDALALDLFLQVTILPLLIWNLTAFNEDSRLTDLQELTVNQQTLKKVPPHYKLLNGCGIWIAIILKHAIWKIRLYLNILYLKQSKILKVQIMVWKEKCLEFLFVGIVRISLQYRLYVGFLKKKRKKKKAKFASSLIMKVNWFSG